MNLRRSSPLLMAALIGTACGTADPGLDPATADSLAAHTDRLATVLESGDGCAAVQEANALVTTTEAGLADGTVPEPIAAEILATTRAAVAEVACPPHDADDDDTDDEKGNGKGKGKKDKDDDDTEDDD